jgi:hypothetical protein
MLINHWKLTAIGLGIVLVTAAVTGVVVANWRNHGVTQAPPEASAPPAGGQVAAQGGKAMSSAPAGGPTASPARPSPSDIAACNQYAQAKARGGTADTIKDALIGGAVGAGVGAAGGAIADGGKGAGKGAGIGGLVGIAAGTLFGLNEANQKDARAVQAYQACMQSRGYVG